MVPHPEAGATLGLAASRGPCLPFPNSEPAASVPPLTLEQYASFRARLSVEGEDNARTWAEFGVTSRVVKDALQAQFAARFRQDPEAQGRFIDLLQRAVTELRGLPATR
jgi:hypothetical protein